MARRRKTTHKPKQRTRAGSFSTFERRFKPICRSEQCGSLLWDTTATLPQKLDYRHWWTVVDCEGKLYITPGFRFVNRFAYIQCELPWTDADETQPDYFYG